MSTVHPPPRHRASGPQGFGRDPHPSGPIPVPAPRRSPEDRPGVDDAVVRFRPLVPARVRAPRPPATAPLPVVRARRRMPLGLTCVLAIMISVAASVALVSWRTVPPSLPTPLPAAPAAAAPAPAPAPAFGDGTFAVGRAVVPGTYRAPGGASCRWARLAPDGAVRARGTSGTVTLRPTDGAVRSAGCGTWARR